MMICNEGRHCPLCNDSCESYIEVEAVRHGYWIECDDYYDGGLHLSEYKCNICGAPEAMFYGKYPTYKYCHCGAKMDGDTK